jgi:drug/metabolite transporter (DMT)-like permease
MSNERLTLGQIVLLAIYGTGMAGGQLLFKMAAQRSTPSAGNRLIELTANIYFFAAFALYCGLAVLWVWILTFTPLSRAYPFVALAFAITPFLAVWLFGEPITLRVGFGVAAILLGLLLVVG